MKIKADMSNSGVYIIENLTKNKFYIGSSMNLKQRLLYHFSRLKSNKHDSAEMQADYNSGDYFIYGILRNVYPNHDQLLLEEQEAIKSFRKKYDLYNVVVSSSPYFCTQLMLRDIIADKYCKEHFNCTFLQLVNSAVPAKIEMLKKIIENPENEDEIRAEFKDLINYQNVREHRRRKKENF